jgi:hypothetical protein
MLDCGRKWFAPNLFHYVYRAGTVPTIKKGNAYCIGHTLLRNVVGGKIEGRIEVIRRRGRRRKQLLDDLKGTRG